MLSDTTCYIYANICSWRYSCDLPNPKEAAGEPKPRLHLDAMIDNCTVLPEALPLGLCLVCNETVADDDALLSPWQLDLIPASNEPPLPRGLEADLTLTEASLKDLKDCLFLTANSTDCSVRVQLAVKENVGIPSGNLAERSFALVEFSYTLIHQRKNV